MTSLTIESLTQAQSADELSRLMLSASKKTPTVEAEQAIIRSAQFLLQNTSNGQKNIDMIRTALGDEALNAIIDRVNNGIVDDLPNLQDGKILELLMDAGPEFRSAWQQHYTQNKESVTNALSALNYSSLGDLAYLPQTVSGIMLGKSDIGTILGTNNLNLDVMVDLANGLVQKEDGSQIKLDESDVRELFGVVSGVLRDGGGVKDLKIRFDNSPDLKTRLGGAVEQLIKNLDIEKVDHIPALARAAREFQETNKGHNWWNNAYDIAVEAISSYEVFLPAPNLGGEGEVDNMVNNAVRQITR